MNSEKTGDTHVSPAPYFPVEQGLLSSYPIPRVSPALEGGMPIGVSPGGTFGTRVFLTGEVVHLRGSS